MKQQHPYTCGFGPALDIIGGMWKALILWEIYAQPRRFGELKRVIPVCWLPPSSATLADDGGSQHTRFS